MNENIVVVGGGIAGLAFALGLHARGLKCRVYEAAPEVREIGVGITVLPHAMRELAALGLADTVVATGIENRESKFFNRFGQLIYAEPRGRHGGYPFAEVGIHRGRLQKVLYDAVIARMGSGAVATNRQLVALQPNGKTVDLVFKASGASELVERVSASLVIACDGVNSAVRRHFYPGDDVVFTGINTWRGVTRRKPILDGKTYLRIGSIKTGKIVIYPIIDNVDDEGRQLINWIAEIESDKKAKNDWNKTGSRDAFLPVYEGWNFDWLDVGQLIREADLILEYPMVDKDPLPKWTFDRVTLMGDAAHPMYPRGSNGAAQALIDARTLAELLASSASPEEALAAYEAVRLPLTSRVVLANRSEPPDLINIRVEELTGDKPFDNLDAVISQDELRSISERYKKIAGFGLADTA